MVAIVGESSAVNAMRRDVYRIARTPCRVLILGENGTGKELIAEAIHAGSARAGQAFVAVNCGAIPHELIESELFGHEKGAFTGAVSSRPGRFEQADGGTLFLDEIGDMPHAMQVKLLRVLETGKIERIGGKSSIRVDVRVVSATNKDLRAEVEAGRFRRDLYYRLAVMAIQSPPLRERKEDIPLLARHFLDDSFTIDAGATSALQDHDWPGNVRELRNVIERVTVLADDSKITAPIVEAALHMDRKYKAQPEPNSQSATETNETTQLVREFREAFGVFLTKFSPATLPPHAPTDLVVVPISPPVAIEIIEPPSPSVAHAPAPVTPPIIVEATLEPEATPEAQTPPAPASEVTPTPASEPSETTTEVTPPTPEPKGERITHPDGRSGVVVDIKDDHVIVFRGGATERWGLDELTSDAPASAPSPAATTEPTSTAVAPDKVSVVPPAPAPPPPPQPQIEAPKLPPNQSLCPQCGCMFKQLVVPRIFCRVCKP